MTGAIAVFVTAPDSATAEKIADAVVTERLAACASIVPGLLSVYSWQGRVNRDPEVLLIIKTRADLFDKLESRIKALHPYEIPEIIGFDVSRGHAPYLAWIGDSTAEP